MVSSSAKPPTRSAASLLTTQLDSGMLGPRLKSSCCVLGALPARNVLRGVTNPTCLSSIIE